MNNRKTTLEKKQKSKLKIKKDYYKKGKAAEKWQPPCEAANLK